MSKYKGLFTFDVENHRCVPVEQADGLITEMDYRPEPEPTEPLIKDEKIRKAVRAWAEACGYDGACIVEYDKRANELSGIAHTTVIALGEIDFDLEDRKRYTIAELCGEEEK